MTKNKTVGTQIGQSEGHSGGDELDTVQAVAETLADSKFADFFEEVPVTQEAPEENEEAEDQGEVLEGDEPEAESAETEEESEEVAETEEPDETVIDILPNAKLRLSDGTVIEADKAILMQADYTRKTQELAAEKKEFEKNAQELENAYKQMNGEYVQMREWYSTRAAQPSAWIAEIASQSQDPTATVAKALYDMAQAGMLDKTFVESFGIESGEVAEIAKNASVTDELAEMRRWREQQEAERIRAEQVRRQQQVYEQEWETIKASRELKFTNAAEEYEAKRQLLMFAIENKLGRSLVDAYDLMTVRKGPLVKEAQVPTPDPDVVNKKRASRAVTPKPVVTGNVSRKQNLSTREAILEAMEGLTV